jgi:hypothetical protein
MERRQAADKTARAAIERGGMSEFIQTDEGLLNTQFIVAVRWLKAPTEHDKDARHAIVQYIQGNDTANVIAKYLRREHLEKLSGTVVPATPDFFVINVWDDEPFELCLMPIVAWRVSEDIATPICADELWGNWAILEPSGQVKSPMGHTWKCSNEFRAARIAELGKQPAPPTTTGIPFSSYIAQGWSRDQMKAAGVIAADVEPATP